MTSVNAHNPVVNEVVMLRHRCQNRGTAYEEPAFPGFYCDYDHLRQIRENAMSQQVHFPGAAARKLA